MTVAVTKRPGRRRSSRSASFIAHPCPGGRHDGIDGQHASGGEQRRGEAEHEQQRRPSEHDAVSKRSDSDVASNSVSG